MFKWLKSILVYFYGIWEKFPDSYKEKIIDLIVEAFDTILREYFRSNKKESNNE
jgi:hypothetical protein